MKLIIEVNDKYLENEVIIKCHNKNNIIQNLEKYILNIEKIDLSFFKDNKEFFIDLDDIIFFETFDSSISAHTISDVYTVKLKLYELENILPYEFIRISKSTIINTHHIYSIDKNLTSSSTIQFYKSHKVVYVSRRYYSKLKDKLKERV